MYGGVRPVTLSQYWTRVRFVRRKEQTTHKIRVTCVLETNLDWSCFTEPTLSTFYRSFSWLTGGSHGDKIIYVWCFNPNFTKRNFFVSNVVGVEILYLVTKVSTRSLSRKERTRTELRPLHSPKDCLPSYVYGQNRKRTQTPSLITHKKEVGCSES